MYQPSAGGFCVCDVTKINISIINQHHCISSEGWGELKVESHDMRQCAQTFDLWQQNSIILNSLTNRPGMCLSPIRETIMWSEGDGAVSASRLTCNSSADYRSGSERRGTARKWSRVRNVVERLDKGNCCNDIGIGICPISIGYTPTGHFSPVRINQPEIAPVSLRGDLQRKFMTSQTLSFVISDHRYGSSVRKDGIYGTTQAYTKP